MTRTKRNNFEITVNEGHVEKLIVATDDIHQQLLNYHNQILSHLLEKAELWQGEDKIYEAILFNKIVVAQKTVKRTEKMIHAFSILKNIVLNKEQKK